MDFFDNLRDKLASTGKDVSDKAKETAAIAAGSVSRGNTQPCIFADKPGHFRCASRHLPAVQPQEITGIGRICLYLRNFFFHKCYGRLPVFCKIIP